MIMQRGFSMLEMLVAMTMTLVISAAALSVFGTAVTIQREASMRSELVRDAVYTMDVLERDFSYMGVGVPRGQVLDPINEEPDPRYSAENDTTTVLTQLRPPILNVYGTASGLTWGGYAFAFVGDLPTPQSDYNGVLYISSYDYKDTGEFPTSLRTSADTANITTAESDTLTDAVGLHS